MWNPKSRPAHSERYMEQVESELVTEDLRHIRNHSHLGIRNLIVLQIPRHHPNDAGKSVKWKLLAFHTISCHFIPFHLRLWFFTGLSNRKMHPTGAAPSATVLGAASGQKLRSVAYCWWFEILLSRWGCAVFQTSTVSRHPEIHTCTLYPISNRKSQKTHHFSLDLAIRQQAS